MSKSKNPILFTLATEESPALTTGSTTKEQMHLSPAEFGQQLSVIANHNKELIKMARKVGSGQVTLDNGKPFGVKELNALVTRNNRALKQLKKNYSARGTRRKRAGAAARKPGDGFGHGSFINETLRDFLATADFGTVDGTPNGTPVRDVIAPLLEQNYLSRSLMTILWVIYGYTANLRFVEDKKKFYRASADMNRFLGDYMTAAEQEDAAASAASLLDKNGNPKPRFNRNKFIFNRWQTISNPGFIPKEDLSQEHVDFLNTDDAKNLLQSVTKQLSRTRAIWSPAKQKK